MSHNTECLKGRPLLVMKEFVLPQDFVAKLCLKKVSQGKSLEVDANLILISSYESSPTSFVLKVEGLQPSLRDERVEVSLLSTLTLWEQQLRDFRPLVFVEDGIVLKETADRAACDEAVRSCRGADGVTRSLTVRVKVFGEPSPEPNLNLLLNAARLAASPFCDVVLAVAGKDFPAHRAVLGACSAVFETMLLGDFKEAAQGRVEVRDVGSAKVFGKFLQYLYTGDVSDWEGLELELLELAERFMVDSLKQRCRAQLWCTDGPGALRLLQQAYDAPKLALFDSSVRWRAAVTVARQWPSVAGTQAWADFQEAHPIQAELISAFLQPAAGDDDDYLNAEFK